MQAEYEAAAASFVTALAQRTTGRLHAIYTGHYAKAALPAKETLAWALVKTELVKQDLLKENNPALQGAGQPQLDAVRESTKTAPFDSPAFRMLAVASCDAWKTPALPGLERQHAFDSASCEDILKHREEATSAVLALTRWIRTSGASQPR